MKARAVIALVCADAWLLCRLDSPACQARAEHDKYPVEDARHPGWNAKTPTGAKSPEEGLLKARAVIALVCADAWLLCRLDSPA